MWSGLCGAQTASASPIRPTDGSGPTTVGWSGERRSQWRCMDRLGCYNVPAVSKSFLFFYGFSFLENKTLNCQRQPLRSFSPSSRSETDCFTGKFTRRSSVRARFRYFGRMAFGAPRLRQKLRFRSVRAPINGRGMGVKSCGARRLGFRQKARFRGA